MLTTSIIVTLVSLWQLTIANQKLQSLTRQTSPEKALINKIISHYASYGTYGRPVLRGFVELILHYLELIFIFQRNYSIHVEINVELHSVVDVVDDVQPSVVLFCWLSQRWSDPLLFWDPKEYDGILEVVVPVSAIWTPDTTLYNGLFTDKLFDESERTAVVQFDGAVAWIVPETVKVICDHIDADLYPFDGIVRHVL